MSKPQAEKSADHAPDAGKKVVALELALKAKTEQLSALHKQQDAAREAVASLESERAANSILTDELARLRFDLEKATESRKLAQQALYDARERFQKEVSSRTAEISRLLKERQDCEPFGYFRAEPCGWTDCAPDAEGAIPLYAAPQKREPLRDETVANLVPTPFLSSANVERWSRADMHWFARAIERAHGIGGQS